MEPSRSGVSAEVEEKTREQLAWESRPFARTFDLISEQYGWTDEQILDLTMARMRQCRAVIWERQAEERRRALSVEQYKLRTLASFMARTKKAAKSIGEIVLVPPETDVTTGKPKPRRVITYAEARRFFGG